MTRNVSYSNVENVEYRPDEADGNQISPDSGSNGSSRTDSVIMKPIKNEAVQLMRKVPYGN